MKTTAYIRLILAFVVAMAATASCTHNNGDIGDWFGKWHLKSIEINSVNDDSYDGNMVWKFQNDIVEMDVINGHIHSEHYGTWKESDGKLILDFTHKDDNTAAGTGTYAPPSQTYLPAAVVGLKILKLSSSTLILQYDADASTVITYSLSKQ